MVRRPGTGDKRETWRGGCVSKAIDVLMTEHRLIERVLGSLESFGAAVEGGLPVERSIVSDYAGFFRGYADRYHHGKEEDILFKRMIDRGFPTETGPLAVMLHEHEQGRARVAVLRQVGQGEGAVTPAEKQVLLTSAHEFIPLLRQHILKEDRILYPMAAQLLTGPEFDAMETAFENFERRVAGDGTADRLRALAERLESTFAPDPERMRAATAMSPCGLPAAG
jgi:hemerythrin-like domain-containing protein